MTKTITSPKKLVLMALLLGFVLSSNLAFAATSTKINNANKQVVEACESADEKEIAENEKIGTKDDSECEKRESEQLKMYTKITEARAKEIAKSAYTGAGFITDIELEDEDGVIVYGVEFTNGTTEVDVKIDAQTGAVVTIEDDGADGESNNDEAGEVEDGTNDGETDDGTVGTGNQVSFMTLQHQIDQIRTLLNELMKKLALR